MPLTRPLTAAAVGACAVVVAAAPAVAAPASPAPRPVAVTESGALADGSGVAGYVASLPDAARRSFVSTFTVPAVTCPAREVDPLFVGVGAFGTVSRTDDTFDYASGDLTVTCTQGVPFYEAAVSTNPERQSGAVSPGDVLRVEILVTRAGSSVTMTDTTSGGVFRVSGTAFRPSGFQPSVQGGFEGGRFPKFGTVRFAGTTIDNRALGSYSPNRFDQTTADGRVVLLTSDLTGGRTFTVKFRSQP